ncbi:MAG: acyl-CoA synthetase FdrA [Deltaproteobacteria bacterium]
MVTVNTVKKNHYQDSMKLMEISRKLSALPGVKNASAIMATEANLAMLREVGLLEKTPDSATANDLVVAVQAQSLDIGNDAIKQLDSLLAPEEFSPVSHTQHKNLASAYGAMPGANVAVVSVPGKFAKLEVAKAINTGLHTFLFSDNMTIEEEIELKERARGKGLLVMGPGCGTSVINGVGLGFSNLLNRGPIGVVAASGTGLQEVTCLIDNLGSGITHAIGVGGRDLSEEVGGIMTLEALGLLENDASTEVLVLVSKPPSTNVAEKILNSVGRSSKPAVICFLGSDLKEENGKLLFASTLEDAALGALRLARGNGKSLNGLRSGDWRKQAGKYVKSLDPKQRYLRGLFSGGTLCYEAQQVLEPILGNIYSNAPLNKDYRLKDSNRSERHTCVDLGEEEFTVGRPHPMIDATLRSRRLIDEAAKSNVAVILFDIVLGYLASPDPAGDLLPALKQAKEAAKKKGHNLAFVSHVCGTEKDPQGLKEQEEKLRAEGVLVLPTNALASRVAGWIATRGKADIEI